MEHKTQTFLSRHQKLCEACWCCTEGYNIHFMLEATTPLPWGKNFISLSGRIPGSAPARRDVLSALQLYLHNPAEPARGIPVSPGPAALHCATSLPCSVFCTNANAALSRRCHLGPLIVFPGLGSTLPSQHDPAFQDPVL